MLKHRSILIAVLLTVLLTVLSGCGGTGNGGGDSQALKGDYGTLFSSITAKDLQGNAVDKAIFSEAELTMVYLWATDCPPCVDSMPKLQELSEAYQDKDVQVLGIVLDIQDAMGIRINSKVSDALTVTSDAGVTFQNLDIPPEIREMLSNEIEYTPTAFFVDGTGTIVSGLYIGSRETKDWSDIIDSLLEK
jgi:thiol-disulfide isomerase/thioredoxin